MPDIIAQEVLSDCGPLMVSQGIHVLLATIVQHKVHRHIFVPLELMPTQPDRLYAATVLRATIATLERQTPTIVQLATIVRATPAYHNHVLLALSALLLG